MIVDPAYDPCQAWRPATTSEVVKAVLLACDIVRRPTEPVFGR